MNNSNGSLARFVDTVDRVMEFFEKYLTSIALIIFTFVIFANVIGRYVLGNAIVWAEEISRYLNVWLVYIAISAGLKYNSHIGVDALLQLAIPKKYHRGIDIFIKIVIAIFSFFVMYQGIVLIGKLGRLETVSSALRIPMTIPYAAIPVGMCMLGIRAILSIIRNTVLYDPATDPNLVEEHEQINEVKSEVL